ncbi:uncharacterized protein LOC110855746 [Folsomia candida]|uniref:uncharacterized protein LOC110855746 n=1 Tax=Folsomia candida TaxID=158441 RepID=UPI000B9094C9|nr:uncharacterized protein LOC110855746 [Folsomia candida]XP_035712189.1 uncharacterized protein LOC110855746 [Folsomia candida]
MDSDSSTDDEETLVVYTCKKCPGQEFTKKNMQAHREFHKSAKKRRQRRRNQSPAPSSMGTTASLFVERTRSQSPKKTAEKNLRPAELKRRKAAKTTYLQHSLDKELTNGG